MFRTILTLTVFFPLFALAKGPQHWFSENRSYTHYLFITEKACLDAQQGDFFFNCTQSVDLKSDGSATVILTDIINSGTYEITDNVLVITLNGASDAPPKMTFIIDRTGRNLIREGTTTIWELSQSIY